MEGKGNKKSNTIVKVLYNNNVKKRTKETFEFLEFFVYASTSLCMKICKNNFYLYKLSR